MEKKESLTNEFIREKFKNQFALVNYAIKLSEQMIQKGVESENVAVVIIEDIEEGRDKFDESIFVSKEIITEPQEVRNGKDTLNVSKTADKKKARRILA